MPLQWTLDLALGIPELDGQHLQLDAHLKELHDAILEGRVPDVPAAVAAVGAVAARHFDAEDRLMARWGAPGLELHRLEHRRFAERLEAFRAACERDGSTMRGAMELGNWLAAWLRDHRLFDVELRRYAAPDGSAGGG